MSHRCLNVVFDQIERVVGGHPAPCTSSQLLLTTAALLALQKLSQIPIKAMADNCRVAQVARTIEASFLRQQKALPGRIVRPSQNRWQQDKPLQMASGKLSSCNSELSCRQVPESKLSAYSNVEASLPNWA